MVRSTVRTEHGCGSYRWDCALPATRAIVLVHGYHGDALATWRLLPVFLSARAPSTDVFSFGYVSQRRARLSALELKAFLEEITAPSTYLHVTLVAHSLGALVCRMAMVEAVLSRKAWPNASSLVLFAPADKGAHMLEMQRLFPHISPVDIATTLWKHDKEPVLYDLEAGSPTLTELEERVISMIAGGTACLRAKRVALAENDTVVNPLRFGGDPTPVVLKKQDHETLCKPTMGFMDPVDIVLGLGQ